MGFYTKNGGYQGIGRLANPDGVHDLEVNRIVSSASDLASLFEISPTAATTFVYNWDNDYTFSITNNNATWSNSSNNYNFVSGFGVTTLDNLGRIQGYLHTTLSNLTPCTSASAVGTSGYTPSYATSFGHSTNGCWFYANDYNSTTVGTGTFGFSSGVGSALGIATQHWGSQNGAYHCCAAVSITCNGITKYFAPKASVRALTTVSASGGGFVLYPTIFTSFSDYATIGNTDVCPADKFVY